MRIETGRSWAVRLLTSAVDELERMASDGAFRTIVIRHVGEAGRLLQAGDVADRASALLHAAPARAYFEGLITNTDLPEVPPESWQAIPPRATLAERHPLYDEARVLATMNSCTDEYLLACYRGDYRRAIELAASLPPREQGRAFEEIAETQAVRGDLEQALETVRAWLGDRMRQRGALIVATIELFRRGQIDEAREVLSHLEALGLEPSEKAILSLGFAGREPWAGYPYPDW